MKLSIASLLMLAASLVFAQDRNPSDYTRVLLPVFQNSPGANGARWTIGLSMRNDGPSALDAFPLQPDCYCCAQCLGLRTFPAFQADQDGFRTHASLPEPFGLWVSGTPGGAFLYVQRSAAFQFSAHLEIGDSSRPETPPVTIPVVTESEFVSGRHSIVGIPTNSARRMTVRVYQLNPKSGAQIAVRAFEFGPHASASDFQPGRLLAERAAQFTTPVLPDCPPPVVCPTVPYHPGYVQISDLGVVSGSVTQQIRIEFEPNDPDEVYWPMVTTTDNATNAVQVFTLR